MIIVEEAQAINHLNLLYKSVAYIRSLYIEEQSHDFDLDQLNYGQFFIVRDDDKFIGCGAYVWHAEDEVELKHMFVDETSRGLGAGKALLKYIEEHINRAGIRKIVLETSKKQTEAIGLYRKFKYTDCHPFTDCHSEDIFMEKTIAP